MIVAARDPHGFRPLWLGRKDGAHVVASEYCALDIIDAEWVREINPGEVADAFEVPLEFLMTPGNHQRLKRDWKGIERQYYAMPFNDRYIWGVTAGILRNLYERIYAG